VHLEDGGVLAVPAARGGGWEQGRLHHHEGAGRNVRTGGGTGRGRMCGMG